MYRVPNKVVEVLAKGPQGPVGPLPDGGAYIATASIDPNANSTIIFEKGDQTTFSVNIAPGISSLLSPLFTSLATLSTSTNSAYNNSSFANGTLNLIKGNGLVDSHTIGGIEYVDVVLAGNSLVVSNINYAGISTSSIDLEPVIGNLIPSYLPSPINSGSFIVDVNQPEGYNNYALQFIYGDGSYELHRIPEPFPYTGSAIISGGLDVIGNVSASTYYGDGSNLEGIEGFPYTGSAEITGSLNVIGDITGSGNVLFDIPGGDGGIRIGNDWGGYQTINWRSNNVGFTLGSGGSLIARVGATGSGGFIIGNVTSNQGTSATLDVRGDTVIAGSNSLSGNYALKVANSSGTDMLVVENDGKVGINTSTPSYTMELGNAGAQLAINGTADNSGHIFLKNSAGEYVSNAIGTNAYNTTYSTRNSRSHIFYFGGLGSSKSINFGDNGNGGVIFGPQGFTSFSIGGVTAIGGISNEAGPTIISDGDGIYKGVIINRTNRTNGYSPEGKILQVQATGSERFNISREGDTWAMGYISASTYYGDGSNLTGIDSGSWDGIFTGSAEITGSLTVTGSTYLEGDLDLNGNDITAVDNIRTSTTNVKIGDISGTTGGVYSVYIGDRPMWTKSGNQVIAIGGGVFRSSPSSPTNSIGIGHGASQYNRGTNSVIIGHSAFLGNSQNISTAGNNVVVLGYGAASAAEGVDGVVAVGFQALTALTTGTSNTALGYQAGNTVTTGVANTIIGHNAQALGNNGVAIGAGANATQDNVTLLGTSTAGGYETTAIGYLANNNGSSRTVALGYAAGTNISGQYNHALGYRAVRYTSGNNNVGVGALALEGVNGSSTFSNTVAIGYQALTNLTTGTNNTAVGYRAGASLIDGTDNTLVGYEAGVKLTSGEYNTFIGQHAGENNTTSLSNVAIGAISQEAPNGGYNVSTGVNSLRSNTGARNVAIGFESGRNSGASNGNIFLGYQSGFNETGSNKLYIENSNSSSPLIYGEFDNNLVRINGTLESSGSMVISGSLTVTGTITELSSERFKENIHPLTSSLEKANQLQGVSFNRIGEKESEFGFIAEQVAEIFPELVYRDTHTQEVIGVQYTRVTAVLLESVKELSSKLNDLEARLERLENK